MVSNARGNAVQHSYFDLIFFLIKGKMQRIQASTTEDPFVAILATATAPTTEETVTVAGDRLNHFHLMPNKFLDFLNFIWPK